MGRNHASLSHRRIEHRELSGHGFVGQAVEAVAAKPSGFPEPGQTQPIRHGVVTAMEGGIERQDLRQIGTRLAERPDPRESLLLVQGRKRGKGLKALENGVGGGDRLAEVGAAVDHAMSDRGHGPGQSRLHPTQQI